MLTPWKKSNDQPRQHIKKQRHYFANKGPSSQSYGFSSSHVWTWELDNKKGWAPRNWCLQTVVLEKTLESSLGRRSIKSILNQPWIFIGRTDAEAETPVLWRPDVKSPLIGKDPDAGKDWGKEEKGETENEMVGCHHQLNGYEFEQTLGDSEGQGSLVCCFHGVTKSQTSLSNWTTTIWYSHKTINILLIFLSFNSNIWYIQMR